MKDLPKALIVGINSFLAKAIYKRLKNDYEIIGAYHENITDVPGDVALLRINDIYSLSPAGIKLIFIVSAFIPYGKSDNDNTRLFDANVMLPQTICNHFKSARIIFCSSVSVYEGLEHTTDISESAPVSPVSAYGISKLWGEQAVKAHASYAILRLSSIYGAGMKEITFVPKIINNALTGKNINLLGAGERLQNYIHVDDAAHLAIKIASVNSNGIFLGVSNKSYSNLDVAKIVQQHTGCNITFSGNDNSLSYTYNNTYTINSINDMSFIDIAQGINEMIEWKKKQF